MNILEKQFKFKENNTNIKTEFFAGLTTFFTMSYLFILSPKILEQAGLSFNSTLTVTCLIVFIGSIIMGLIANRPYAVAPFLGETAFISYTLVNTMGFSIKTAFAAIFISGCLLLLLSIFNIRAFIVNQIPQTIKLAFCSGLGLFFIFIAMKDIGIVNFTQNSIPLETGNFISLNVILGLFCFISIIFLVKRNNKAAVLISILITTLIGILIGDVQIPDKIFSIPANFSSSILQTDFSGLFDKNFLPMLFVIFILVNIDTAGAIVGLSYKGNFVDQQGNITNLKKIMIADSFTVMLAPIMGTTTPGTYLDSMTGISAGGRTGFTAITVGLLFLIGLILSPIISIIPSYAYAPALLYVGIIMSSVITKIDFEDISEFSTAIFIITAMIFTYNIGTGIICGFIIYPILKLLCSQKEKINIITWIMFIISVLYFLVYPY